MNEKKEVYFEKLIKIFEKERNNQFMITDDKYEKEVVKLFSLDSLNLYVLQAIRDAIVCKMSDMAWKDEKNRFFYMSITSYVTTTIDSYIVKVGGEV